MVAVDAAVEVVAGEGVEASAVVVREVVVASVAVLGRAADSPVERGRRSEVLRRSAGRQRLRGDQRLDRLRQPRGHLPQALGRVPELARGRMLVVEMPVSGIVRQHNREIGQASAQVVHHVPRRCLPLGREAALALVQDKGSVRERALQIDPVRGKGLRIALVPDKGSPIDRVPHSYRRIVFRGSVLPQAREHWEVLACRTAWRIGRA